MKLDLRSKIYLVTDPSSYPEDREDMLSGKADLVYETTLKEFIYIVRGSIEPLEHENPMIFTDRDEAEAEMLRRLKAGKSRRRMQASPRVRRKRRSRD